jgi:hypothetical protein
MDERLKDLELYGMITLRKNKLLETQVILKVSNEDIRTSFEDHELLSKYFVVKKKE